MLSKDPSKRPTIHQILRESRSYLELNNSFVLDHSQSQHHSSDFYRFIEYDKNKNNNSSDTNSKMDIRVGLDSIEFMNSGKDKD